MEKKTDNTNAESKLTMYNIQRVLNNNALLVLKENDRTERILLGKGIGYGKKLGDSIEGNTQIKEYKLAREDERKISIGTENGIEPVYLEAAGRIIEEAERVFDQISSDILLALADHIAFAARREQQKIYVPNPFIPDIKVLFGKEYAVAIKSRDIIKEYAGYEISDDEAGFIALHIHSGLSHEQVSETLRDTQIISQSMQMIVHESKRLVDEGALTYTRLLSHLYYMLVRTRSGNRVGVDLNSHMEEKYPMAMETAGKVCDFITDQIQMELDDLERGYLAVHIERYFEGL